MPEDGRGAGLLRSESMDVEKLIKDYGQKAAEVLACIGNSNMSIDIHQSDNGTEIRSNCCDSFFLFSAGMLLADAYDKSEKLDLSFILLGWANAKGIDEKSMKELISMLTDAIDSTAYIMKKNKKEKTDV